MILDFSIQLAAASAAIAKTLGEASGDLRGFAICAAGTKDRQDRMLSKFAIAPVSGIDPVFYEDFKDDVRILCCSRTQRLNPQFIGFVDKMAQQIGMEECLWSLFVSD